MRGNHKDRIPVSKRTWSAGTLSYTVGGIVVLFALLLWGDFAWSMKERATFPVAALMIKSFGVSDLTYSLLMVSAPYFTNIFLMPIVSYRSDRYRGKGGRRIPYLLTFTPFVVAGLFGLAFTPMLAGVLQNSIGVESISYRFCGLIVFTIFWMMLDLGTTMTNAIFMALVNDVVPGALLGRFLGAFRAVSLGTAIVFNYFLMGSAESRSLAIFAGLGVLYGVGMFVMCWKVKEGGYPPPVDVPEEHKRGIGVVKTYFVECFSHPIYIWTIAAFTLCGVSVLGINIYGVFYAKSIDMSMALFGKCQALISFVSVFLSFACGSLSDRFHPIRTGMASIALCMAIMLVGGFVAVTVPVFAAILVLNTIAIMSFNTFTLSLGPRLFPKALYAQFNSAMQMVFALVTMVLAPATGIFLDYMGNDYRHVFFIGSGFAAAGLVSLIFVLHYFKKLGGDENYQPPQPRGETRRHERRHAGAAGVIAETGMEQLNLLKDGSNEENN